MDCSCPYDGGGWCKHIVAVALAVLDDPGQVEVRPALETLADGLDREALQRLVTNLATDYPHLVQEIEQLVDSLHLASEPAPRRTRVDPEPLRR